MLHEVFHFVLVNGVRVASAILPAAPLLGRKLPPAPAVKNIVLVQAPSSHHKKDALRG
jgi:hypothetical protein